MSEIQRWYFGDAWKHLPYPIEAVKAFIRNPTLAMLTEIHMRCVTDSPASLEADLHIVCPGCVYKGTQASGINICPPDSADDYYWARRIEVVGMAGLIMEFIMIVATIEAEEEP